MASRRQATLFVPLPFSAAMESIRSRFNSSQFGIIRAHVTLCREDEVTNWDLLASRLAELAPLEVVLTFGMPVREDDLVYLPATGSTDGFDALRNSLLATPIAMTRKHMPHITLIHPRNGVCSDSVFDAIVLQTKPVTITFRTITLIEQVDGGCWQELQTFG